MNKTRQAKTNGTKAATRIVHIAIPLPTLNRIRKIAAAEDRSINYKISTAVQEAFPAPK
jgi:hypothetical protein